jgi:hypothetical protein
MTGKLPAAIATAAVTVLCAAACTSSPSTSSSSSSTTSATTTSAGCAASMASAVAAPPGYQVCLLIAATTSANHPDNILVSGANVFVGWQNITAKDGSDTKTSTIGQYTSAGKLVKSWSVRGHTDGMRIDPSSGLLWVMCNEDGSPRLFTISTSSDTPTEYTLPSTPHGGGFDDVFFTNGMALIDASNPSLNKAGVNVFPALYKVTLSGTQVTLTKLLMGNANATTVNTPVSPMQLNLTDPDSMTVTPQGDLLLDDQGDNQLIFIHGLGTPQQTERDLVVGTQIDDTAFPTSAKGCLLVADNGSGVYSICSSIWVPGTAYSAAPNDSGVIGFVGTTNLTTGQITPFIVGLANPHGMGFLQQ